MAYQEGQYISQFLNTLPQQLANYAQQQEQIRQFDVSSKERERQFDALQGLRESAEARSAEQYEYGKERRSLIDLLLRQQRGRSIDIAEAEERKTKALEGRGGFERLFQLGSQLTGMPQPYQYERWSETDDEWAQRITGYDLIDRGPMDLPEGLEIDPALFQYINQLSGYNTPKQNLLGLTMQGLGGI